MRVQTFFYMASIMILSGCHTLVTTNPLSGKGGKHLQDGRYILILEDIDTLIPLYIAYDKTNAEYQVDLGVDGLFQAQCSLESPDQFLVSITTSKPSLKKAYGTLTECEGIFLTKVYANARLTKKDGVYDVWTLKKTKDISDGCGLTALPTDQLLAIIPKTNVPPFAYSGKLWRIHHESGGAETGRSVIVPTGSWERFNSDARVLIDFFFHGNNRWKSMRMTKSENDNYLYYYIKEPAGSSDTNCQKSCMLRIRKRNGEGVLLETTCK